jgi:hypothetical protein
MTKIVAAIVTTFYSARIIDKNISFWEKGQRKSPSYVEFNQIFD